MNLPMKDQLKQMEVKPQDKKKQKRKIEQLSQDEWKDLMGVNMRVHTKVRGRVRQK